MRARPQQVAGPWDSRPGAGWGPQAGGWDSSAAPSAVHNKPAGWGRSGVQKGRRLGAECGPSRDWPCRDAGAGGDAGLSRALRGPSQPLTDEAEQGLPKTLHPPTSRRALPEPSTSVTPARAHSPGRWTGSSRRLKSPWKLQEGLMETLQGPPTTSVWRLRMSVIHKQERLLLNKRTFLERIKSFKQKARFLKN